VSAAPAPIAGRLPWVSWEFLTGFRTARVLTVGYIGTLAVPMFKLVEGSLSVAGKVPDNYLALAFLASLLLSLAHMANEICCPQLIRQFPSFVQFHKAVSEFVQQASTIEKAQKSRAEEDGKAVVMERHPDLDDAKGLELLVKTAREVIAPYKRRIPSIVETFEEDWHAANRALPAIRYTVAALYAGAGGFGSALIGQITWVVVRGAGWL